MRNLALEAHVKAYLGLSLFPPFYLSDNNADFPCFLFFCNSSEGVEI